MSDTKLTNCTVYLDANFDLYQAGFPYEAEYVAEWCEGDAHENYVDDFATAFSKAARLVGEALGVDISIDKPPCSQYGGLPGGNVESEEWARDADLWQVLHNCVVWDRESASWMVGDSNIVAAIKELNR